MTVQKEIKTILERNKRVEADKAWETSKFRMGAILLFTYVIAFLFMVIVGIENPWLGAFVPVIGYALSTLSLPPLKKWWVQSRYRGNTKALKASPPKLKEYQNLILAIGIFGMVLSVIGTFVEGGSILQKVLFLIGASFLITTAFYNKQKMFVALQAVILVGAVLGFFPAVHTGVKFWLMASSAVVAVAYLVSGKYFKTDPWGIAGSLGLFCIALGFAMNAEQSPSLFYALLLGGGLFVALYSGVQFFYYRVRISMLWLILNVVFAINPLFYLLGI